MKFNLLVLDGKTTKRKTAPRLPAILGRSREADITVGHPLISRRHCQFFDSDGLLMVRDLASLNGTMIGGRRIELAPLLPGAIFTIGPVTFQVLYEYSGDADSIPETRFVAADDANTAADDGASTGRQTSTFQVLGDLPESPDQSLSGDLAMPDLMALADAEVDEAIPPAARKPARPIAPQRPAPSNLGTPAKSGGHAHDSPWAEDAAVDKPPLPLEPPATVPLERHALSDEEDAEIGGYLEGLQ
jgi:pSer/pThr/pTyr-binding forkhead associated (FHA) protein